LYLDAIEESVSMVQLAYARLYNATVLHISRESLDEDQAKLMTTEFLSQSWLVVDATNRLRVCVQSMPGLRRTPAVESMLRATAPVLSLRNYIQHLDTGAPRLAQSGRPLWGTFRYIVVHKIENEQVAEWAVAWFVPGRLAVGEVDAAFKVCSYSEVRAPVDHITLAVGDDDADLSVVADAVALFGHRFDRAVAATPWHDNQAERTIFDVGA
jgi:hypothetical protein